MSWCRWQRRHACVPSCRGKRFISAVHEDNALITRVWLRFVHPQCSLSAVTMSSAILLTTGHSPARSAPSWRGPHLVGHATGHGGRWLVISGKRDFVIGSRQHALPQPRRKPALPGSTPPGASCTKTVSVHRVARVSTLHESHAARTIRHIHTCTHQNTHTHTHTLSRTHAHACTHTCTRTNTDIHSRVCALVRACTHAHTRARVRAYLSCVSEIL